jgi:hypothetical protein
LVDWVARLEQTPILPALVRTESRPLLSGSVELAGAEPAPFRSLTAASPAPPTHGRLSPVTTSIFMMPGLLAYVAQEGIRFGLSNATLTAKVRKKT